MAELSIIIPARNEMFLRLTIEDILKNMRGDTEVIAVFDGQWAVPGFELDQHPNVSIIYNKTPLGQRGATNQAARLSRAKYVMKLDAHCALDEGFDVKLMQDCEKDWTVIPRMYNLHAFDWVCNVQGCQSRKYQGPTPIECPLCHTKGSMQREIIWKPRLHKMTEFWRFDRALHFQYWGGFKERPESQGDIVDVMTSLGACFFMHREQFWKLGGLDEKHGSWGQFGVEVACKAWLSGGRHVVNKKTWFAHMFRTQGGDFGFPYELSGKAVEQARRHSRDLWENNKWPQAVRPFSWIIDKFAPVPGWEAEAGKPLTKGALYFTDSRIKEELAAPVRQRLQNSLNGHKLVSVSLKPLDFGTNITFPGERGLLTMFRQILAGLEALTTDVVFLCEHDVLYHPSHFEFTPPKKDVYYYNENTYKVDEKTGQAVFYYTKQVSGLCAYRELLVQHYKARIAKCEAEGFTRAMGFEPGCHRPPRGVDSYKAERWMSQSPNVDIRHRQNLTESRWNPSEFRNPGACEGWKLADEIPGWGVTKDRFNLFLQESVK